MIIMYPKNYLKMALSVSGLIGLVLLSIIIFRPDVFWSAERKVIKLSSLDIDNTINENFIRLQKNGMILDSNNVVQTEQHIFQVARIYYDAEALCVLYTVETPASAKWRKWIPPFGTSRVVKSRQVATIELTDDIGTDYSFLGFNSSTDAVQKTANIACYSAPPIKTQTLYLVLGDSEINEKHANFQIELVP